MQNILIADDVIVNRKLIKKILSNSEMDVEIFEASNGAEALKMIKERQFSVIILDIMMPGIDGLQVLKEIKSTPEYQHTSVIICSAVQEIESVEQALTLGALDYFTKPLTVEQIKIKLPLKIKNALEFYEQNRQLLQYNEMFKQEMRMAEQLQKSMITEYFEFENATMYGKYIPCNKIGGDMFTCKQVANKLWFMIADISGRGVAAAMMSTMMKVIFNSSVMHCNAPNDVLEKINCILYDVFNGSTPPLITAFVGYIEGESLYYANAGHPYPLVYRRETNTFEELEQAAFLLGLFENIHYNTQESSIPEGDLVMLYTDGLRDAVKDYREQSPVTVKSFCESNQSSMLESVQHFIDDLTALFEKQDKNGFDDDVAVMVLEVK